MKQLILQNEEGFTLLEVLVAAGLSVIVFSSVLAAFLSVNALKTLARHNLQVTQVVRGEIERLKGIPFANIVGETTTDVSFDSGADHDFTTTNDNLSGEMAVEVKDYLDMDSNGVQATCTDTDQDGDTDTNCFDLDGDGTYDAGIKPVRVTFTWSETFFGNTKDYSVFVDTLIAQ